MQWRNLNAASFTMCWSQHLCFFLDVWVGPIVRERRFWVVTRVSCVLLRDRSGHIGSLALSANGSHCRRRDVVGLIDVDIPWEWDIIHLTPQKNIIEWRVLFILHERWNCFGFFDLALWEFMFTFRKYIICHRLSSSVHKISCCPTGRWKKEASVSSQCLLAPRRGHNDLYI